MIEVFNRSENGKDRLVATAATYADLFSPLTEGDLKAFGYLPSDRCAMPRLFGEPLMMNYMGWNIFPTRYCYIVFDDGRQVNPDRLVGLFRKWRGQRTTKYRSWRTHKAYGGYRRPRTTHDRRWAQADNRKVDPAPLTSAQLDTHEGSPGSPTAQESVQLCDIWGSPVTPVDWDMAAPPVRGARNAKNLPTSWDDKVAHNDKCWKTQSKRRHQWKDNS